MEEIYPRLVSGGGLEILRTGLSLKDLYLITPPPNIGYSVHFLRDSSGLGQAIAYIRPVQADLDSSSLETKDHAHAGDAPENEDISIGPTVKCLNCSVQIPMNSIRNHMVECGMDNHHKQFKKVKINNKRRLSLKSIEMLQLSVTVQFFEFMSTAWQVTSPMTFWEFTRITVVSCVLGSVESLKRKLQLAVVHAKTFQPSNENDS
ncbi:uncharacterized protein LOC124449223 [Xenia sp. Carnegie-2017]|uniref:uncharacterized protein LOC124449223 n=1 Tax=Xenia sp. Carnegie-2017 TaxID=2897299 RepID=UPI001F0349ED|nr:uncharacterized protein LOC124449223 [Xenia sp. Carnegie-2017]